MDHKSHIGDDADHVRAETVVQFHRLVVTGSHEHFRPRTLTEQLLLLVERIADSYGVLVKNQFVEKRQVRRVITHGIFHQENCANTFIKDIVFRIQAVLYQFDDSDDEIRGVIPVEEIIDVRAVVLLNAVINLLAEGREQDDRTSGHPVFRLFGKIKDIEFAHAVHGEDKVKRQFLCSFAFLNDGKRFSGRFRTRDRRRIREVQFGVFLRDLHVNTTVLLECKTIVVVAHKEYSFDAFLH